MADRLAVTVQVMDRHTPVDATFAEAIVADGHKFLKDGRVFLYIITDTVGAPHLITIQMPTSSDIDGLVVDDLTYDLPDNQNVFMGPFPPKIYNQSDGMVYIDWEGAEAAITWAVIRMPS
jgi:hypothetical protein